jgi:hypothetical protein
MQKLKAGGSLASSFVVMSSSETSDVQTTNSESKHRIIIFAIAAAFEELASII